MSSSASLAPGTQYVPRQLPVWSAPLVSVALAMTGGIVADRFAVVPLPASLGAALVCVLAGLIVAQTSRSRLALVYLLGGVAGLAAAHHHWQRYHIDATDVRHFADHDGKPARLRGSLTTAPITQKAQRDALRTFPSRDTTRFVLRVTQVQNPTDRIWQSATGLVQVTVIEPGADVTVGDDVEVLGRLALPAEAMNPGEFDYASFLRDQGITATLTVLSPSEMIEARRGWPMSLFGWLAALRGWGQQSLQRDLSRQSGVAAALLLGEGSSMTGEDWEQYQRTGVLHVLAISGQHLAVLAGFLWLTSRVVGLRRRQTSLGIALLLIGYALLTGGRPPVMRAAWIVAVYCGGILLQRPVSHANTLALAWIGVALVNPTDVFNAGCQLSFLAVAVLVWGVGRWAEDQPGDPLERTIDEARSWQARLGIMSLRSIFALYAMNAIIWLAVSPLVAAHFHNVSPIALLIGPPMVVLTSLALLSGFALLLFGWLPPLAWVFGFTTQTALDGCELIVKYGQRLPGAYFYVADVPVWWLWLFYVPLLIGLASPLVWRHGRWALLAAGVWLALGLLLQALPHRPGELRCTFLAVGHGGCTVIETQGGRVLVYDAGATTGPDVTRRQIAPFLWSRGIRRIDVLILSHADLDHFNGVPQLAERFAIGRVLSTPTFAQRDSAGVQKTMSALEARGLSVETVHAGYSWDEDDVSFAVLHPPAVGPAGKENARSLVLLVKQGSWSMLLTGDLEEEGLTQVLALKPPRIDVLMAPHHGSDKSNLPGLAKWAKPKLVVSSQTAPLSNRESVKMYEQAGATVLATWPHGAITLRPGQAQTQVETYRTRLKLKPFP